MKKALLLFAAAAVLGIVCKPAAAYATDNKTAAAATAHETFAVTQHSIKGIKTKIKYSTTAGRLILKSDASDRTAQIFFVAYEKKDGDKAKRPITFAFNGGPGSSSVWLHLGAIGPRRIHFNDDGSPLPPPACLVDNEFTWLEFTDVVFIDPVGTGYS
ncbi:MAG: peptidase S10, partial [Pseudomonadota bacterium]